MRAALVLGLGTTEADLAPFCLPGVELDEAAPGGDFSGYDAVLIFGGDGTVHHQLAALVKTHRPVLAIPAGSGNDFASACGIHSVQQAVALWKSFCQGAAQTREVDLGVIVCTQSARTEAGNPDDDASQIFFCNAGGTGLDAQANSRANRMPRWLRGHGGYILSAIWTIALFKPLKMRVLLAGAGGGWREWLDEPATLVAIANNQTYGGGIRIAPRAQIEDGKLDICFIRSASRLRLLSLLPKVMRGRHLTASPVEYAQAERLRIETERPMDCYADGEFACHTPIEIRVLPRALRAIAAN